MGCASSGPDASDAATRRPNADDRPSNASSTGGGGKASLHLESGKVARPQHQPKATGPKTGPGPKPGPGGGGGGSRRAESNSTFFVLRKTEAVEDHYTVAEELGKGQVRGGHACTAWSDGGGVEGGGHDTVAKELGKGQVRDRGVHACNAYRSCGWVGGEGRMVLLLAFNISVPPDAIITGERPSPSSVLHSCTPCMRERGLFTDCVRD